jgi:hypothetical protein
MPPAASTGIVLVLILDGRGRAQLEVVAVPDDAVPQQQVTSELDMLRGDASGRLASAECLVAPG